VIAPEAGWVAVALLGKARGNRGEVTALALSSKSERYQALKEVYLFGKGERFEVESTWFHDGTLIFKFRGVDTISDAEQLSGAEVRIPFSERVQLDADEYFESDLIGCELIDRRSGRSLGRVSHWEDGGGSGLLVMDDGLMVPFARAICVEIDVTAKRIVVELPEGLREISKG
jgi:16S rRNA processing protein RimM